MTEDLGTPTRPHALTGEQWRFEVRTDDPPSPSADERWIRSDLDSGDRVATLKCRDGTEIPLFATGTAEETVREARRFHVGGQTVYAPLAPVDEAAYPSRRVQHAGEVHAYHDRVAPGPAIPDSVVYDFETGDVSRWDTVNDLSAVTQPYNGGYSGLCDNAQSGKPQARVVPSGYDGGLQPATFEFFYNERSSSFGGGIRLVNSNGNIELGIGTNNPNYIIDDGNGDEVLASGEVGVWHKMTVMFDWPQMEFSVDFENLSNNNTYTDSNRPLKQGVNIESIQIDDYTNDLVGWQEGGSIDMNFDDISLLNSG